jgi:SAM-dependent methyltransferase
MAQQPPSFFRQLRLAELDDTVALLERFRPEGRDLLEVGAGTGWQARRLGEKGYRVEAIDLPVEAGISNHARSREWPITDYDGVHIPFPDSSFDIIYSSNVLEHVFELGALNEEMKRVLRPDGIAVHLLPNPQWRLLSLMTYYPAQLIDFFRFLRKQRESRSNPALAASATVPPRAGTKRPLLAKAAARLLPRAHGAVGTALSEIVRFSRSQWEAFFRQGGWQIVHQANNGIIASGDYLFASAFPLRARRRLGKATGGIAHVYVLKLRA